MQKSLIVVLLALALAVPSRLSAEEGKGNLAGHTLTVTIKGFKNDKGKVRVALFSGKKGFPSNQEHAMQREAADIVAGKATVTFKNLSGGTYAVGAFHDDNSNSKLDKNMLGIPSEGWGASNAAKGFMGPPEFSDAAFTVSEDRKLEVEIEY